MSEENKKQNKTEGKEVSQTDPAQVTKPKATGSAQAQAEAQVASKQSSEEVSQTDPAQAQTDPAQVADEKVNKEATNKTPEQATKEATVKLQGLFAFKIAMTSLYNKSGSVVPVTALDYKPWRVSQIKTKEKEGYSAVQVACSPQKNKRSPRSIIKHLIPAGFKEGARYTKEVRQETLEGVKVGQVVSIESLKKGDRVKITSRSKGRGFAGVIKRWGFSGGRASHGAKNHREPGSIGQHTEPSRVFPGRKMPGHYGFRNTSYDVEVYDVLPKEQMILIKGSIPGARNSLVSLIKKDSANA